MGVVSSDTPRTEIASVATQCHRCAAPLASDQRYCLACGERRGKARFSLGAVASAAPAPAVAVREERHGGTRVNAGLAFVTFVAVLLLAMGVGVLIGHTNNQPVQRAASPGISVVSVNGGGPGADLANTTAATKANTKTQANKPAPVAKKVIVKAQAAAANVLGGKNLPPATVTVGQKGSGPGYTGGKFDGNFFGSP